MMSFQGYQLVAWWWSQHVAGFILLCIRTYINWNGLRNVPFYRDALLFLGMLINTGILAMTSIMNDWDVWNIKSWGTYWTETPENVLAQVLKMSWASPLLSMVMTCIIEVDLLLYHDIAPKKYHPKFFRLILVGWFCVALYFLSNTIWSFVVCRPFRLIWKVGSTCSSDATYVYVSWSTFVLSEFALYIIPLIIIFGLNNWTFQQKLSAAAMFLVGSINVLLIIASLIIQIYQRLVPLSFDAWVSMYTFTEFMSGATRFSATLVVCMPQLKTFYLLLREKYQAGKRDARRNSVQGLDDAIPRKPAVAKEVAVNINVSTLGIPSRLPTVISEAGDDCPQHNSNNAYDSASTLENGDSGSRSGSK